MTSDHGRFSQYESDTTISSHNDNGVSCKISSFHLLYHFNMSFRLSTTATYSANILHIFRTPGHVASILTCITHTFSASALHFIVSHLSFICTHISLHSEDYVGGYVMPQITYDYYSIHPRYQLRTFMYKIVTLFTEHHLCLRRTFTYSPDSYFRIYHHFYFSAYRFIIKHSFSHRPSKSLFLSSKLLIVTQSTLIS